MVHKDLTSDCYLDIYEKSPLNGIKEDRNIQKNYLPFLMLNLEEIIVLCENTTVLECFSKL